MGEHGHELNLIFPLLGFLQHLLPGQLEVLLAFKMRLLLALGPELQGDEQDQARHQTVN